MKEINTNLIPKKTGAFGHQSCCSRPEFKKKKAAQKLVASEQSDMTALEEKLTYEDLRFFRSLARSQLRKENVGVKKEEPQKLPSGGNGLTQQG